MAVVEAEAAERQFDGRQSGWLWFAALTLGIAGVMRIFDAFWALRYHGVDPKSLSATLLGGDLHRYGWLYLVVGIVLVLAAGAVMARRQWARWTGIVAGFLGAVTAGLWLPAYPAWSVAYLVLSLAVVYALGVHAGPVRAGD